MSETLPTRRTALRDVLHLLRHLLRRCGGRCTVEDSGPGIAPEHRSRLFESFFTTKASGMGMGLPICQSIIEGHGGRITADNDSAEGGARFSFTLPTATLAH